MNIKLMMTAALLALTAVTSQAHAAGVLGGSIASSRVNGGDFDGDDVGWKAFIGGYGEIFGIEGQYVNFGNLGGPNNPEAHAWVPALVVGVPVGSVNIYGKIGQAFYTIDRTALTPEFDDEDIFYGVGVRAGADNGLGFRVEYERFKLFDADVDLVSAGLEFRF